MPFGPQPDPQDQGIGALGMNPQLAMLMQGMEQQLQAMTQRAQGMQGQADQLFGQAQQLAGQPMQMNPMADFGANLLGNMSQAIAPQMNGQQVASQTIASDRQRQLQQRQERLRLLVDAHDRMAREAAEAGNTAEHAKYLAAAEKWGKAYDENAALVRGREQLQDQKDINTADNQSRERVAALDNQSRERVAKLAAEAHEKDAGRQLAHDFIQRGATYIGPPDNPEEYDKPKNWSLSSSTMSAKDFTNKRAEIAALAFKRDSKGKLIPLTDETRMMINNADAEHNWSTVKATEINSPVSFYRRIMSTRLPVPAGGANGFLGMGKKADTIQPLFSGTPADDQRMFRAISQHYDYDPTQVAQFLLQLRWDPLRVISAGDKDPNLIKALAKNRLIPAAMADSLLAH